MIGYGKLKTNTGCSYPDSLGPTREFTRSDVVGFGKSQWFGSSVIWFWVRLADGTELHVKASAQPAEDKKWLAALSKRLGFVGMTSRDVPEVWKWVEIGEAAGPICAHGILV